jgi:hypothetical protein
LTDAEHRLRVAAVVLPDEYEWPPPPSESSPPIVQDTYRQTKFLLSGEINLLVTAMDLQLRIQRDSHHSKFRTHALAALTIFWSRAYAALRDGATLLAAGAYASIPQLIRSAAECIGVQGQLRSAEMDMYESWLETALLQDHEHQALDLNLGRYRAASILASDEDLGRVYRFATDIATTPFGGSLFLTGADSTQQRVLLAFADQTFHAGYAELMMGWLLRLCERQLAYTEAAEDVFNVESEVADQSKQTRSKISAALENPARCRADEVLIDGERRYLVVNFRRASSGATRKLLL